MKVSVETTFNTLGEKVVFLRLAAEDDSHCVDTIFEPSAALRMAEGLRAAAASCSVKGDVQ